VDVCEGDGASGAPMAAPGHQPATFIPLPVNAGDLHRHVEHRRLDGEGDLVLEHLGKGRQLLADAVRIDGDLVDQLGKGLPHDSHTTGAETSNIREAHGRPLRRS